MTPDVHALTGAYVLDAVSDIERAAFERHLDECEACSTEVGGLRATASRLGTAATVDPPAELRARVLAKITEVRQLPPEGITVVETIRGRPAGPRWALRMTSAAAAVLLVAATVLGVLLARQRDTLNDTRQYAESLSSLLQAGDAQVSRGESAGGGSATAIVSRSQDRALLLATGMPELPADKDLEAWLVGADSTMIPAGLLPKRTKVGQATALDLTGIGTAKGIGVTVEPAGGSTTPSGAPIMTLTFPTA